MSLAAAHNALIVGYEPPGPVAEKFLNDIDSTLVGLMGPYGSGKTTVCPVKGQYISRLQPPDKHDGVIRSRGYVLRTTYRELWDKTMPSWKSVFPDTKDWPITGSKDGPAQQTVRWFEKIGSHNQLFEMLVEFKALGDKDPRDFTGGLLPTWVWLNEADTFNEDAATALRGRLFRYPMPHLIPDGWGRSPAFVMCDFNAPNESNWTYRRFFKEPDARTKVYVQPSGLSPEAENPVLLKAQPNYYKDKVEELDDWEVARFVENKIGYSRTGKPVYTEYDVENHASDRQLTPWRGLPILLGVDNGLTSAVVFGQKRPEGNARFLQELVTPEGEVTDAETMGERVREILAGEYAYHPAVASLDPACWDRDANSPDGRTWADRFMEAAGIPCIKAPVSKNDREVEKRHRAVRKLLKGWVGLEPRLLVDKLRCPTLHEGFITGYKVKRIRSGEETHYGQAPMKNHFSHVHDAAQYLALLMGMQSEQVDEIIELQADRLRSMRAPVRAGGGVLNDF